MNTDTTNHRAVADLTVGDHLSDNTDAHELVHVLRYRDGDGRERFALTLRPLTKGEPWVARYFAGETVRVASADELADIRDAGRRKALADALHQVAHDIVEHRMPVPRYSFTVGGVVDSRAELERWTKHLGADIHMSGDIPVVDKTVDGLTIHFQSAPEPERKPLQVDNAIAAAAALESKPTGETAPCGCVIEYSPIEDRTRVAHDTACQEWLFTFGAGQQHDGRFVRIRGTETTARKQMNRIFGHAWCDQYSWQSFDANGLPARLTELPVSEWPAHAADVPAGA